MTISVDMTIGGATAGRYVETVHSEQSCNLAKDPGKFDIKLANVGNRFFGAFGVASPYANDLTEATYSEIITNPKTVMEMKIINERKSCSSSSITQYQIFTGEVQNITCDEQFCNIQGSCIEGGFASGKKKHTIHMPGTDFKKIVEDLLKEFGFTGENLIDPLKKNTPDKSYELKGELDFHEAMDIVSRDSMSVYYFDEYGKFWFVPPLTIKGAVDLTGKVLIGSKTKNMVGHCNRVWVFGGVIPGIMPSEPLSEIKSHANVSAMNDETDEILEDINANGLIVAPWIYRPNADTEECKRIANNMIKWYMQYKDVPTIKVSGCAPLLLTNVSYLPWNGSMPPVSCGSGYTIISQVVTGVVIKRVIDLDAESGFTCQLDIATNAQTLGEYTGIYLTNDPDYKGPDTPAETEQQKDNIEKLMEDAGKDIQDNPTFGG